MSHLKTVCISLIVVCATAYLPPASAASFTSNFNNTHDRVWTGGEYWANPMEDWRIHNGKLECTSTQTSRNIYLLTHSLSAKKGDFTISVQLSSSKEKPAGAIRIGIKNEIKNYRAAALRGRGIDCGLNKKQQLFIGKTVKKSKSMKITTNLECTLTLSGTENSTGTYTLKLSLKETETGKILGAIEKEEIPSLQVEGGIALVNGGKSIFAKWSVRGSKIIAHPERAFGPILWAMHTLSDSRSVDGYVMKMNIQMPPLSKDDGNTVIVEIQNADKKWQKIASAKIEPASCTAGFRITKWNAQRDTPYRLSYSMTNKDGSTSTTNYSGTIRRDPIDKTLAVAAFTGNTDYIFPNSEIVKNVTIQNPDLLFFSGDQLYEGVGGFGIIRKPVDSSILNYLRKWYLFGWAFGDIMRDRPTICLPDDHDVYQGNIWGEGGRDCKGMAHHAEGGYAQPAKMVNVVHRTQTWQHPDPFDPTPIEQGITVYYGDMVYGRVSFAIIADRMFKSGPQGKVDTGGSRPDWVVSSDVSIKNLDKPGLILLGERQLKFLEKWATDWRKVDMKVLLSQTIFCNLANYHGGNKKFVYADLDSNGWPQSGRNRALKTIRKSYAFQIAGDQHLPSLTQYGVNNYRDAGWAFCVPSIAAGYPRSWLPDKEGKPVKNRPPEGLPNTGDYLDGFNNHVTVYAVGNPALKNRKGKLKTGHDKSSGYGIVRLDKKDRTITVECWKLLFDAAHPKASDQFPGWPRTIDMFDGYGTNPIAYLPTLTIVGEVNPVIQIINEKSGKIESTVRIKGTTFRPGVSEKGIYTIKVVDTVSGKDKTVKNIKSVNSGSTETVTIQM